MIVVLLLTSTSVLLVIVAICRIGHGRLVCSRIIHWHGYRGSLSSNWW